MTCRGIVKGKFIELETALPDFEGQSVDISLRPTRADDAMGSPARILQAMDELEHLEPGDIEEFEKAVQEGRLPVKYAGIFDEEPGE